MDSYYDRLIRVVRQHSNARSLPAAEPLSAAEDAARNVASTDVNRLAFWSDEAFSTANEQAGSNQTDGDGGKRGLDSRSHSPLSDEENVKFVLRSSQLKKINDVTVTNAMTLIGE